MHLLVQYDDILQIKLIFLILSYHTGNLHKHYFITLVNLIFFCCL
jgi:hypothetical protein